LNDGLHWLALQQHGAATGHNDDDDCCPGSRRAACSMQFKPGPMNQPEVMPLFPSRKVAFEAALGAHFGRDVLVALCFVHLELVHVVPRLGHWAPRLLTAQLFSLLLAHAPQRRGEELLPSLCGFAGGRLCPLLLDLATGL